MIELRPLLETASTADNPEQRLVTLLGLQPILIHAPAGCGKTQALAERAAALVEARVFLPHQRILALTFSNRARDNLAARLRERLGVRYFKYVTVRNFHGLAARVVRAHGEVIDVPPGARFPERGWRKRAFRELEIVGPSIDPVERALRDAKRFPRDDDEVMAVIEDAGVPKAVAFERLLRSENRLDFDDLLRHGERVLLHAAVRRLYRLHFACVFVDEVQDLTEQQFRLVSAFGLAGITAVADRAQGIYAFAGADVDAVLKGVSECRPAIVEFSRSYRSAPRVLDAVNALAAELGSPALTCANPSVWQTEGRIAVVRRVTLAEEARELCDRAEVLMGQDPQGSIAFVVRSRRRAEVLRRELQDRAIDFEDWDDSLHNTTVVSLLRDAVREVVATDGNEIDQLEKAALVGVAPDDPELMDEVTEALEYLRSAVDDGISLQEAVAGLRRAKARDAPVGPGLHILTGHSGKGQQFDHVLVVGLEEGHIPDFRARTPRAIEEELRVLHVMASRARKTLVFTRVERTQNQYGRVFYPAECQWLSRIDEVAPEVW